ncbi:MAG: segregation/condensation protein A [Candidatus Protochlamydia sp.]|nr:segregation/condensation protein A [Candidatus Protochlamydia sp.]
MISKNHDHFALKNFEGPLEFLLSLIQKEEINIYDVSIQTLTQQFLERIHAWEAESLDKGAEFVGSAAYLVWLKSKTLLPAQEQEKEEVIPEEDPHFEIIHHLLDYCRFKQAAKQMAIQEEKQQGCYFRGLSSSKWKRPLGLDAISLDELSAVFGEIMLRTKHLIGRIEEEDWKTSDKIKIIRRSLEMHPFLLFESLFSTASSRLELVVIFLAILELMKLGSASVSRDPASQQLMIYAKEDE